MSRLNEGQGDAIDYQGFPCLCQHAEASHLRVSGRCRIKGCDCKEFLNLQYIMWLSAVIAGEANRFNDIVRRFRKRAKASGVTPTVWSSIQSVKIKWRPF